MVSNHTPLPEAPREFWSGFFQGFLKENYYDDMNSCFPDDVHTATRMDYFINNHDHLNNISAELLYYERLLSNPL